MKKIIGKLMVCLMTLAVATGCKTAEEQAQIDADNLVWAESIADQYFEEGFEYDFHFYGGGGEGDLALYMYIYKNGDVINCVGIPAKENAAGPFVYYDCTLHQYSSGRYSLESFEDSESVD